ncbi:MAG: tRNA lysidine(34) synthetase TilS [candidate division Zixibacteria bacterium]|nr:tRNA lysidine(34) synthetase TilS [candidate division Zixibacteria bacterium]
MALLHILTRLRRSLHLTVSAVYINHQLRPRAAAREEKFCATLCRDLHVDLEIVREDIPGRARRLKTGVEETARNFRYQVFDELADRLNCNRIALGHHADDQVETVLFRLFRGTGMTGLQGIPARRGRIVRPLIDATKEDIFAYLKKHKLGFCEDRSNRDLVYSRNFIRHKLLPQVRRHLNEQADRAVLNLAATIGDENAYLKEKADKAFARTARVTPGGKIELDLRSFVGYDTWLRRRLLRRCIKAAWQSDLGPSRDVVDRLLAACLTKAAGLSLPGKLRATVIENRLVVSGNRRLAFKHRFVPGEVLEMVCPALRFRSAEGPRAKVRVMRKARSPRVVLNLDELTPPFCVRSIRPGDRFRPLGMDGRKKIGDYLTDRKVPSILRDEIPVLCDADGIVWLVGFEIDERARVLPTTRKVLSVEYVVITREVCEAV